MDAQFIQLFVQALLVPATQRNATQHVACKCMQMHAAQHKGITPPLFVQEYSMPTEVQEHISVWAKNPATLPHPIHENQGLLNLVDLDVWYWSHRMLQSPTDGTFILF